MIWSPVFAFLHFMAAFTVMFTVVYERLMYKQNLTVNEARRLQTADRWYGVGAIVVLIVGFLRVFYFEKGSEYYFSNPFFHLKLTLFIIIGLLSIYPTIRFMKWNKSIKNGEPIHIEDSVFKITKRILNLEVALLVILLFSASFMAKGLGLI